MSLPPRDDGRLVGRPAGVSYVRARVARCFAAVFPNSELYLLERAGHYVQVDEPQEVARLIASTPTTA